MIFWPVITMLIQDLMFQTVNHTERVGEEAPSFPIRWIHVMVIYDAISCVVSVKLD